MSLCLSALWPAHGKPFSSGLGRGLASRALGTTSAGPHQKKLRFRFSLAAAAAAAAAAARSSPGRAVLLSGQR